MARRLLKISVKIVPSLNEFESFLGLLAGMGESLESPPHPGEDSASCDVRESSKPRFEDVELESARSSSAIAVVCTTSAAAGAHEDL